MNVEKLANAIADARDKAFAESSARKTANQMQELCRELVGALTWCIREFQGDSGTGEAYWFDKPEYIKAKAALKNAATAFNPTPAPNGCVEPAATVPACVGTGETDKALGVGSCPVCGGNGACLNWEPDDHPLCMNAEHLAITRAKQLAEAEAFIRFIAEVGGKTTEEEGLTANGTWCAEQARSYFYNKPKEATA